MPVKNACPPPPLGVSVKFWYPPRSLCQKTDTSPPQGAGSLSRQQGQIGQKGHPERQGELRERGIVSSQQTPDVKKTFFERQKNPTKQTKSLKIFFLTSGVCWVVLFFCVCIKNGSPPPLRTVAKYSNPPRKPC